MRERRKRKENNPRDLKVRDERLRRMVGALSLAFVLVVLVLALVPVWRRRDERMILVGDSRTMYMYYAMTNQSVGSRDIRAWDGRHVLYSARSQMGYHWMREIGVPRIRSEVRKGTTVVFLLGVNDYWHRGRARTYARYINRCARQWGKLGARCAFVSVNPVGSPEHPWYGNSRSNETIEAYNDQMRALLSPQVRFIDTYDEISDSYVTVDGLHYNSLTYHRIFRRIRTEAESWSWEESSSASGERK